MNRILKRKRNKFLLVWLAVLFVGIVMISTNLVAADPYWPYNVDMPARRDGGFICLWKIAWYQDSVVGTVYTDRITLRSVNNMYSWFEINPFKKAYKADMIIEVFTETYTSGGLVRDSDTHTERIWTGPYGGQQGTFTVERYISVDNLNLVAWGSSYKYVRICVRVWVSTWYVFYWSAPQWESYGVTLLDMTP
ncbi:MAG: hypothetical protein ACFFBD_11745 [Candidatus Hodarchaeota archaeon]